MCCLQETPTCGLCCGGHHSLAHGLVQRIAARKQVSMKDFNRRFRLPTPRQPLKRTKPACFHCGSVRHNFSRCLVRSVSKCRYCGLRHHSAAHHQIELLARTNGVSPLVFMSRYPALKTEPNIRRDPSCTSSCSLPIPETLCDECGHVLTGSDLIDGCCTYCQYDDWFDNSSMHTGSNHKCLSVRRFVVPALRSTVVQVVSSLQQSYVSSSAFLSAPVIDAVPCLHGHLRLPEMHFIPLIGITGSCGYSLYGSRSSQAVSLYGSRSSKAVLLYGSYSFLLLPQFIRVLFILMDFVATDVVGDDEIGRMLSVVLWPH